MTLPPQVFLVMDGSDYYGPDIFTWGISDSDKGVEVPPMTFRSRWEAEQFIKLIPCSDKRGSLYVQELQLTSLDKALSRWGNT